MDFQRNTSQEKKKIKRTRSQAVRMFSAGASRRLSAPTTEEAIKLEKERSRCLAPLFTRVGYGKCYFAELKIVTP